ncbi:uncharacterized protein N7469_000950 [Penicillium citrinum]|uniref:Uncharacterized protein n=1 Tax=Penicillium citrinum TaxID=5077 RepID=A0A9W9PGM8_PENCI|nr:uncharacterized protein N7469_000950 [Penicillium citrinum]KAJ5242623.1 hypothetical protein N7469_000950 [Penicillium citrinum]
MAHGVAQACALISILVQSIAVPVREHHAAVFCLAVVLGDAAIFPLILVIAEHVILSATLLFLHVASEIVRTSTTTPATADLAQLHLVKELSQLAAQAYVMTSIRAHFIADHAA